ncbi:MAG TPA: hypothetical protein PLV45_06410 [bacterium]|nr:hypothetical protein [bacterium]
MELLQILKPLMELEYQMHRVYMWFSDVYHEVNGASLMFRTMAKEELKHRDIVQQQMQLVKERFREYDTVEADLKGVVTLTDLLRDIADKREKMPIREALDVAVQIEQSAVETHYRFLIAKASPVLTELTAQLADADRVHVRRLIDFRNRIS